MAGAPPNDSVDQEPPANDTAAAPPTATNKIFKTAGQTGHHKRKDCTSSVGRSGAAKGQKAATPQLKTAFQEKLGKRVVAMAYTATIEKVAPNGDDVMTTRTGKHSTTELHGCQVNAAALQAQSSEHKLSDRILPDTLVTIKTGSKPFSMPTPKIATT